MKWQDSKTKQVGILVLTGFEFIRRWLQHVLPKGFMRLRHFGFLSPAAKATYTQIKMMLGALESPKADLPDAIVKACCRCGKQMKSINTFPPKRGQQNKAPP